MISRALEKFLNEDFEVPAFPPVVVRLNQVLASRQTALSEVADVLSKDTGLSARLLELVNSSGYGLKTRVETISRAVVVVGAEQIQQLVLATSVVKMFENLPEELIDLDSFWRHSMGCGVVARRLAELRQDSAPERFFVGGMLHDVGKLALFLRAPERMRDVFLHMEREGCSFQLAEREVFGFDHAELGFQLCRLWNLPGFFREMAGFHHQPDQAFRHIEDASLLHVADFMANALELGTGGQRFIPALEPTAWDRLGFCSAVVEEVVTESLEKFQETLLCFP